MDITAIRLQRLKDLLAEDSGPERGKRARLGRRVGKAGAQISQWLNGDRSIDERSARDMEGAARLPRLWFDGPQDADIPPRRMASPSNLVADLAELLHQVAHEQRAELADVMAAFIRSGGAARYSLALVELLGGPMPTPSLVSLPPLPKPPPLPGPSSPDGDSPAPHSAGHAA